MKKLVALLCFAFIAYGSFSNVAPMSSAYISELYFDENGDWTIELYFEYFAVNYDTGYVMITSTDTATFKKFPDSTNIILITNADLSKPLFIDKSGDKIWFENPENDIELRLTPICKYGDFPGAEVDALFTSQSLVTVSYKYVKDTSSSLGYIRDPAKGVLQGFVYDSLGIPLPYIRINTNGISARTIWTDENGFFSDTLYAKNYSIAIYDQSPTTLYIGTFTIEPDSVTTHNIYLPVSANVEFSGYCFLDEFDNYADIKIILTPECPFAPNDTLITNSDGLFYGSIKVGHYMFRYSKYGYFPFSTFLPTDIFFDSTISNQTLIEGMVHEIDEDFSSGIWKGDYPYWIFSDITIREQDLLTLNPGTQIIFKRRSNFNIYGTLKSEGTEEDSVCISNDGNYQLKWRSLSFYNESSAESELNYTEISNNTSGIRFYNSSPNISNSFISRVEKVQFYGNSSPTILTSILDSYIVFLYCYDSSAPNLLANIIYDRITCYDQSAPLIMNNSYLQEVVCGDQSTPIIYHNDFYNKWAPVVCYDNATPEIQGNIFVRGGHAIDCRYGNLPNVVQNNLFYELYDNPIWTYGYGIPGLGVLDTININGDSCDVYFNLVMDPMFTNPENGDFSLMPGSPCIDAGNPDFEYDPDSTIADIGALYFDQTGVFVEDRKADKPEIKLYHYPNPASDYVNFVVEGNRLTELENARIKIYDLSGIEIGELVCPFIHKGFGKKIYRFDLESDNSIRTGTYVYTLESNGQILSTNKLILVQ